MKIYAYEVREDEKKCFEQLAKEYGVEITLSASVPKMEDLSYLKGYEGITMLGQGTINRELLEAYKELGIKCISTRTIGFNHIDVEAAKELGIDVCNANYAPNGVADFTVMMILMSLRHYKQAFWRGYVNDFSLKGLEGRNLKNMVVGVMGTGKIGTQVIENLSGFGCEIIAYDVYENDHAKKYATYVDLDTLYARADIITLHMPLLPSTEHIINKDSISKMKDGVILVNCARGELAEINALVEGIESTKIGALGMDTMEGEQGIIHEDRRVDIIPNRNWFYLHQFRNVIMTPHMAFYTEQAVESMVQCGVEGLIEMAKNGDYATKLTR